MLNVDLDIVEKRKEIHSNLRLEYAQDIIKL